jgi:hypothetical protein
MHRARTGWAANVFGMNETPPIGNQPPTESSEDAATSPGEQPAYEPPTYEAVVARAPRRQFRDRVYGLWTLIGAATGGLLLGVVAATSVGALHHDHDGRPDHFLRGPGPGAVHGRGDGDDRGFWGGPGGRPPAAPGQVQPTPPSDLPTPEGSDATPGTSSSNNT